jgi:hypothetical protein
VGLKVDSEALPNPSSTGSENGDLNDPATTIAP